MLGMTPIHSVSIRVFPTRGRHYWAVIFRRQHGSQVFDRRVQTGSFETPPDPDGLLDPAALLLQAVQGYLERSGADTGIRPAAQRPGAPLGGLEGGAEALPGEQAN
jgi:hypothetical protein